MGIKIESAIGVGELAQLFDVDAEIADKLEGAGVALAVNPKSIDFVSEDEVIATAHIKMGILNMAVQGKIGNASKAMMKADIEKAFVAASDFLGLPDVEVPPTGYDDVFDEGEPTGVDYVDAPDFAHSWDHPEVKAQCKKEYLAVYSIKKVGSPKVAAIKKFRQLTGAGLAQAKDKIDTWAAEWDIELNEVVTPSKAKKKVKPKGATVYTEGKKMLGDKVLLRDATEVLQPTGGTDSDSKYFAIAIGPLVNVAARARSGGHTSIRVEGNAIDEPAVVGALLDAGFSKQSDHHWSIHMNVGTNELMVKKTVFAMLGALGLPFDKLVSDITPIIGKGA